MVNRYVRNKTIIGLKLPKGVSMVTYILLEIRL